MDRGAVARAEAFRRLVGDGLDAAYARAALILGDRLEAEDAVHDAAERAWRRWTSLRDEARFEAWFARIVVNECRDRLRRRRVVLQIDRLDALADRRQSGQDAPALIVERDRIRRAMARLTPDERIAIVLRYDADLSVPAIGTLVGSPDGTIKSRLHAAHGKLRVALEADDGG